MLSIIAPVPFSCVLIPEPEVYLHFNLLMVVTRLVDSDQETLDPPPLLIINLTAVAQGNQPDHATIVRIEKHCWSFDMFFLLKVQDSLEYLAFILMILVPSILDTLLSCVNNNVAYRLPVQCETL